MGMTTSPTSSASGVSRNTACIENAVSGLRVRTRAPGNHVAIQLSRRGRVRADSVDVRTWSDPSALHNRRAAVGGCDHDVCSGTRVHHLRVHTYVRM